MFHFSEAIRKTKTSDGAVILDIRRNRILATNVVGATILELMQGGREETQIVEEISRLYEIPVATAAADVFEFVKSLTKCGILLNTEAG
jgi:Coenzyme PQQ synthesis protein D (PqqD)